MLRTRTSVVAYLLALMPTSMAASAETTEPLLRQLPPGLFVTSSVDVPPAQATAIGKKLGGNVQKLSNSVLQVHGRPIQVNIITATDEANAKGIVVGLSRIKSFPFCLQKDRIVVEYHIAYFTSEDGAMPIVYLSMPQIEVLQTR